MRRHRVKNIYMSVAYLVCLGVLAACSPKEAPQPVARGRVIRVIMPISKDEAVLISANDLKTDHHDYLELIKADGRRVWQTTVDDFQAYELRNVCPLVANDAHIFVVGKNTRNDYLVLALARADGREVWRHALPRSDWPSRPESTLTSDSERLVVVYRSLEQPPSEYPDEYGVVNRIIGLDSATGARIWPLGEPEAIVGRDNVNITTTIPGRLLVTRHAFLREEDVEYPTFELDTATGETLRRMSPIFAPYRTPIGILGYDNDITLFSSTTPNSNKPQVLVTLSSERSMALDWPMGIFNNLAILGFDIDEDSGRNLLLMAIDIETGATRWAYKSERYISATTFATTEGVFPRMLPIFAREDNEKHAVAILDLATGIGKPLETREGLFFDVIATRDRTIVYDRDHGILYDYDGETGKQSRAPYEVGSSLSQIHADALRFGRLWCYDTDAKPTAEPAWTVIDIPTWKVLHQHGR